MEKLTLFIIILLSPITLFTQNENSDYGLLWEVQGKDFKTPSYIFGSTHLNDARLFNFPDSLLYYLKSADAFANEIQIDSFTKTYLDIFTEDTDLFFGDNTDTESDDSFDSYFINGKPTFIDAYLYRIAKNLKKELFGLEPEENQLTSLDLLGDDYINTKEFFDSPDYENLVLNYTTGNLQGLKESFLTQESSIPDSLSKKRNRDMVESIIRIGKSKSLFSVVGLMHLIEPDNILSLLEEQGYTLRKIGPVKNFEDLDSYYYDRPGDEWVTENVDDKYNFTHPGISNSLTLEETVDIHFSFDVSLGLLFMNFFVDQDHPNPDTFFNTMLSSFKQDNDTILLNEVIETDSSKTMLIKLRSDSESKDFRFIYQNNRFALQVVFGFSQSALDQPEVQKYFNSLQILKPKNNWKTYTSQRASCKYIFPVEIPFTINRVKMKSSSIEGFKNIYYKTYSDESNNYVLRYNDQLSGIQINNSRYKLDAVKDYIKSQYSAYCIDSTYSSFNSYSSLNATFSRNNSGNSVYFLTQESMENIRNEQFFNGFSFLPFNYTGLEKVEDVENDITFNFSPEFIIKDTSHLIYDKRSYYGKDTANSATLYLTINNYNPFYFTTSFDSTVRQDMENTVLDVDSVLMFSIEDSEGFGKNYAIKRSRETGDNIIYISGFYENNRVIEVSISYPHELEGKGYAENIFNSIVSNLKADGPQLWDDGSSRLYKGLLSEDSTTFYNAYAFLDWKLISDDDIDGILDLLAKELPKNHPNPNLKLDLIEQLSYAPSEKVIPRLKKIYVQCNDQSLKLKMLEYLTSLKTETALNSFFELQTTDDPLFSNDMITPFFDSLNLFVKHYESFKTIREKNEDLHHEFMLLYAYSIKENGLDSLVLIKDSIWIKDQLTKGLAKYKQDYSKDSSSYFPSYLFTNLYNMPTNSFVLNMLDSIKNITSSYSEYNLVSFQFSRDLDVSEDVLLRCIKKLGYRYELLYLLQANDAFYMVPDEFKTIEFIASAMVQYYYYENESIWIDETVVGDPFIHTKNKSEFYLVPVRIKFTYSGNDYEFLTFAGPFNDLDNPTTFSDTYMVYLNKQINNNYDALAKELLDYIDNSLE